MMEEKFKLLATLSYPHELPILEAMLKEADIEYYIYDEYTTGIIPIYSLAIGGIKVMVKKEDFDEALHIYEEFTNNNSLNDSELEQHFPQEMDMTNEIIKEEKEIEKTNSWLLLITILIIILAFIILYFQNKIF